MAKVKKQEQFQILIESEMIKSKGELSYLEIISEYMEDKQMTEKQIHALCSQNLIEKLFVESSRNNLLTEKISIAELPIS
jgi:hypothetical protein